ncbi:MAG: Glycine-tRNA ligase [Candidatus Woesebacteria bacterium GW2011_GWD1_38_10]|uniref:glycine--tRNA ligase n=2 Tax=Candidatus Woeseibacteriota TaxID=1752722 RepID=A0A0G0LA65_9BACT|nr:MAG: Glycine-tRNA ligase [Candidatus Woesebacteria bacterium GW2011_GWD1_38_10]KKQ84740.1 MAG: Glycine-tRNA ligase [Candidatus Woesebacteria bacterium GW2011_GWA1_38_8]
MTNDAASLMDKVTALCKRRGFVFPGSEIYGGLANTYDYGPLGTLLLRNIKNSWWNFFVGRRSNIYPIDSNILMNPKVWEASGHVAGFTEALIDCKACRFRTRGDHLIGDYFAEKGKTENVEGYPLKKMEEIINHEKIPCPKCKKFDWTKPRVFNNLFETSIGIISGDKSIAYLRGETAQGMFVNFRNVLTSMSPKLPFGLAQSGPAFRNEITPGKFVFRTLQFSLSEFEYYFDPEKDKWENVFEYWRGEMWKWAVKELGIKETSLRWRAHTDEERSFYSKRTEDIEYNFPWGYKELYGLAYRTDYDLKNHMEKSGVDLQYTDSATGRKFIPHVVEPAFGMDRSFMVVLFDAYSEENKDGKERMVLKLDPKIAPYKAAVFPLLANKPELIDKARAIYDMLYTKYSCIWDDRGNIGKRYFAQDEIGTPWCITVDFDTLKDDAVTVRDRDTAKQERIGVGKLEEYFSSKLEK